MRSDDTPARAEPGPGPPRFLALVGPTASGKTALSIRAARILGAEIVSMDSRQVYRGMDVGTAKVTLADRARVPHHGLDLLDPDEAYSAGRFARDARSWIRAIRGRGRLPLLVGGTGFFLKALTEPIFREPPPDPERLRRLRAYLARLPRRRLEAWVGRLDPERARLAAEGGPQRLGRTVEVALLTGRPLSWWHRHAEPEAPATAGLVAVLDVDPATLDRCIDARVSRMAEQGLVGEVQDLLDAGFRPDDPAMTATGYREMIPYLRGECTLETALDDIRRATRRYARRQRTWLRHQLPPGALGLDGTRPVEALADDLVDYWRNAPGYPTGSSAETTDTKGRGRR